MGVENPLRSDLTPIAWVAQNWSKELSLIGGYNVQQYGGWLESKNFHRPVYIGSLGSEEHYSEWIRRIGGDPKSISQESQNNNPWAGKTGWVCLLDIHGVLAAKHVNSPKNAFTDKYHRTMVTDVIRRLDGAGWKVGLLTSESDRVARRFARWIYRNTAVEPVVAFGRNHRAFLHMVGDHWQVDTFNDIFSTIQRRVVINTIDDYQEAAKVSWEIYSYLTEGLKPENDQYAIRVKVPTLMGLGLPGLDSKLAKMISQRSLLIDDYESCVVAALAFGNHVMHCPNGVALENLPDALGI